MTDDLLYWVKSGNAISRLRNGVRKLKTAKSFHRLLGIMICCVLICAALLGAGAKDPQQVTATVVREDRGTGQEKISNLRRTGELRPSCSFFCFIRLSVSRFM